MCGAVEGADASESSVSLDESSDDGNDQRDEYTGSDGGFKIATRATTRRNRHVVTSSIRTQQLAGCM